MPRWLKEAPPPGPEPPLSPDVKANIVSAWLFSWCFPILKIGYSRPLEAGDMYRLDLDRHAVTMGDKLEHNFYDRVPIERRPRHLRPDGWKPTVAPSTDLSPGGALDEKKADGSLKEAAAEGSRAAAGSGATSPTLPAPASSKKAKKAAAKEKKEFSGNDEGGKVRGQDGKAYDQSLIMALQKTFFWPFWLSAVYLIISSLLTTLAPIVTKQLLSYITVSYSWAKASDAARAAGEVAEPPHVGRGLGLAFGLFIMQEVASLFNNQYMQRGQLLGFMMRTSLIANISRKSLRFSGKARVAHPNGHLITLVSNDASFMEWSAFLVHFVWVQPIIIVVGCILLLVNLGYSALVGIAILVLNTPIQTFFVKRMFSTRQAQLSIVDQRVRLLTEVLNGIRVVKLYAFETFFGGRIGDLRAQEMSKLKTIAITRAGMTATMSFVPVAAAVLTFITYSLSGHTLDAATIFASLQLFNIIRQPLVMLPMALTICSDAYAGLIRIAKALLAEELEDELIVDSNAPDAIRAFGNFRWETSGPGHGLMGNAGGRGGKDRVAEKAKKAAAAKSKKETKIKQKGATGKAAAGDETEDVPNLAFEEPEKPPFQLRDVDISIPRGGLTCVVGTIGSGKSSLLQALIGEMKRESGSVVFGGSTAYAAQAPWVQNCSLRDNILFGREYDEERFENVIRACALETDLEILPNGLETEIGEKGINLSGGQKARVCLARTVYFNADIVLLDDPLSAVDAGVSKHIVEQCLLSGPLADKTRILVTHHLDVLPKADHIILLQNGRILEQGTYADLLRTGEVFGQLIAEFGSLTKEEDEEEVAKAVGEVEAAPAQEKKERPALTPGAALMQEEERNTGAIAGDVYGQYLKAMGSLWWGVILFAFYALSQGATVGNNIFLGLWSAQSIAGWNEGQYMGVYAALGVAAGLLTFGGTFLMYLRGITASEFLFNAALDGVMRSKVSWFDTTPLGRITSRLSKDITTLDNQLPMQWNQLLTMAFSVLGTIALVFYTYPILGVIFVPMAMLYWVVSTFYRSSSREVKRIDSIMRSHIYTSYGEMLSGLASVRAFGQQPFFTKRVEDAVDVENRAAFLTITLQRWLGVRLDFLGNLLVLGIALFGVGFRTTVDPSKLGVVLTYGLSATQVFSQLVTVFATVEQDMNTAERVAYYGTLTPEGLRSTPNDPPASWPDRGVIDFKDVRLRYREGLPEVLKGVSFTTRPGEKVGIVGRTGAGKSSLLQALFRIVELGGGEVNIDGVDVSRIGLDALRTRLAVIPQDALLYSGTVRENLDPTGSLPDADLHLALRKAGLIAPADASDEAKARYKKFGLDELVTDEGSNMSAGERQLLALGRALVKNSRIIVLDEATSSVDVETDATMQRAIQKEFTQSTLLCIAHRLATIAFYDRVIVMDQGVVVEFDEPLNLFDQPESIFRSMCDKAGLSREDIVRIRRGAGKNVSEPPSRLDSAADLAAHFSAGPGEGDIGSLGLGRAIAP